MDGDKPEAMTAHWSSPRGYGMFTGRPLSNVFSMISSSVLISLFTSNGQLSSQTRSHSLSLLICSCCQTVCIGQVCSLSPVCSPELAKNGFTVMNIVYTAAAHCNNMYQYAHRNTRNVYTGGKIRLRGCTKTPFKTPISVFQEKKPT